MALGFEVLRVNASKIFRNVTFCKQRSLSIDSNNICSNMTEKTYCISTNVVKLGPYFQPFWTNRAPKKSDNKAGSPEIRALRKREINQAAPQAETLRLADLASGWQYNIVDQQRSGWSTGDYILPRPLGTRMEEKEILYVTWKITWSSEKCIC
jgi:hypothetical protein